MEDRDLQQITWDSTPTAHSPDLSTTDDPNRTSLPVPPIADAQPSLRTRLSRYFGLRRIPRQARPKSLTRPRSDQLQAQGHTWESDLYTPSWLTRQCRRPELPTTASYHSPRPRTSVTNCQKHCLNTHNISPDRIRSSFYWTSRQTGQGTSSDTHIRPESRSPVLNRPDHGNTRQW